MPEPRSAHRPSSAATDRTIWSTKLVLTILLVVGALLFIISNRDATRVAFFGLYFSLPMWLWITLLVAVGVVIGSLRPWGRRKRR